VYRIIGQPINMRYISSNKLSDVDEVPEDWKRITRIAEFGIKHGYKAAVDAFMISKSTYYNYARLYKSNQKTNHIIRLRSKRPINVRKATWDKRIIQFIRNIRTDYPNIGKSKIKFYLDEFCMSTGIKSIATGTIQNIINSHQNKLRTKNFKLMPRRRENVVRKPANYRPRKSGECIALDSMEFRMDGKKKYVVVAQDEATNLLFAYGTSSHTSRATKEILDKAHDYLPWKEFNTILTDNGSEFCKDFAKYLKQNNITHYHTYPKTPKQNARCERVNRTIQDEFMIKHGNLLFDDITLFNKKLARYLYWFNFKRVHYRFSNKMTPFQYHLQITQNHSAFT